MVYLDNWALSGVFANDRSRQQRLLDALGAKGTLFLSLANILELPNYPPIRKLFEGIGRNWYPVEWSFFSCMRREDEWTPEQNCPALSIDLLRMAHLSGDQDISPLSYFVGFSSRNGPRAEAIRKTVKDAIQRLVREVKAGYRTDLHWINKAFPSIPFDPKMPTRCVFTHLMRALASEQGFTFTPNDGMDLVHTVVPVAYADFVLLDQSWTRRVRSISMPGRVLHAFYEAEVDKFLDVLDQFPLKGVSAAIKR